MHIKNGRTYSANEKCSDRSTRQTCQKKKFDVRLLDVSEPSLLFQLGEKPSPIKADPPEIKNSAERFANNHLCGHLVFQDVLIFFKPNVRGHLQIRVSLRRGRESTTVTPGLAGSFESFLKKLKTMSIFVSNEHGTTSLEIGPRTELAAQFAGKLHIARGCFLKTKLQFLYVHHCATRRKLKWLAGYDGLVCREALLDSLRHTNFDAEVARGTGDISSTCGTIVHSEKILQ